MTATATTQATAASTQLKINTAPMRRRCRFATREMAATATATTTVAAPAVTASVSATEMVVLL